LGSLDFPLNVLSKVWGVCDRLRKPRTPGPEKRQKSALFQFFGNCSRYKRRIPGCSVPKCFYRCHTLDFAIYFRTFSQLHFRIRERKCSTLPVNNFCTKVRKFLPFAWHPSNRYCKGPFEFKPAKFSQFKIQDPKENFDDF
jgi:hypothetical protein